MEISPLLLLWLTVDCFLLGVATGILHDSHRLIRVLFGASYQKRAEGDGWQLQISGRPIVRFFKNLIVFLQDVFLFLFASVGLILLNYEMNDGQLRIFSVVSLCFGFFFYYVTLGRLLLRINRWVADCIKRIFGYIFSIVSKPIRTFVDFFGKNAKNIFKKITKAIAKKRKKVYNINRQKSIGFRTTKGFLTDEVNLFKREE